MLETACPVSHPWSCQFLEMTIEVTNERVENHSKIGDFEFEPICQNVFYSVNRRNERLLQCFSILHFILYVAKNFVFVKLTSS